MLILSRKKDESIVVRAEKDIPAGTEITIKVVEIRGSGKVRIGIEASQAFMVNREEIHELVRQQEAELKAEAEAEAVRESA